MSLKMSLRVSEKTKLSVDVAIVGGGIVGTAVARELSKYKLDILLIEKEAEVGWGTTKANSGIVHGGFHEIPGTLKAKYCFPGNQMYPQLCEDLDVCFKQNGILMVARNAEELEVVHKYIKRGRERGVNLKLLSKEETLALEPNLEPSILGALYAPEGGCVMPFELAAALMENAICNGAQLLSNNPVIGARTEGSKKVLETPTHIVEADIVINAAGLGTDKIARMFGDDYFEIKPRKGQEYVFDMDTKGLVTRTIFPVPIGDYKGVLVIPTAAGNLMMGPTMENSPHKDDKSTTDAGLEEILGGARTLVPALNARKIIAQFAGVRASRDCDDFIVEFSPSVEGLIHLAGIDSPGLTAAPAIAVDVVQMIQDSGYELVPKEDFQPKRRKMVRFNSLPREEQDRLIHENPAYGRIICRCETITEAEIVDAIHRGARTVDGVKFRARAGAGRCQGGFCQPLVMAILAKELGVPFEDVTKRGPGSEQVRYHAKELLVGDR